MYLCLSVFFHFFSCSQKLKAKKLGSRNNHEWKFWTYEIRTRKRLGPTEHPREKILDPWNNHEGTMARCTRPMRPTMARNLQNLAHSKNIKLKRHLNRCELFYINNNIFEHISHTLFYSFYCWFWTSKC